MAASIQELAGLLAGQCKFSEAEPLYREVLAMRRKLLGDEHQDVAAALHNLAWVLQSQGKLSEAEPLYREALAMQRKLLGNEHPDCRRNAVRASPAFSRRRGNFPRPSHFAAKRWHCAANFMAVRTWTSPQASEISPH